MGTIERTLAQAFACALIDAHIHTRVHLPQRTHTGQPMYVGLAPFAGEPWWLTALYSWFLSFVGEEVRMRNRTEVFYRGHVSIWRVSAGFLRESHVTGFPSWVLDDSGACDPGYRGPRFSCQDTGYLFSLLCEGPAWKVGHGGRRWSCL